MTSAGSLKNCFIQAVHGRAALQGGAGGQAAIRDQLGWSVFYPQNTNEYTQVSNLIHCM